jgi:hypothetical protein
VKAIAREIENTKTSELTQENPDDPICMDTPVTSYKIYPKNKAAITIALRENCKMSFLKDGEGRMLYEVLEGLQKLDHLK